MKWRHRCSNRSDTLFPYATLFLCPRLIGIPKEIKNHEYRFGLTPAGVRELVAHGHQVLVQRDGGKSIGLTDDMYEKAGAQIVDSAQNIFARAEMIIKVKEPQPVECAMLRTGQVLYTYLHLAPDPNQTTALVKSDRKSTRLNSSH